MVHNDLANYKSAKSSICTACAKQPRHVGRTNGISVRTIQAWLGHKSLETTMLYLGVQDSNKLQTTSTPPSATNSTPQGKSRRAFFNGCPFSFAQRDRTLRHISMMVAQSMPSCDALFYRSQLAKACCKTQGPTP